ncbi:MAG: hypothetical protein FJY79_10545, partial [Candidatus Aminicenantes bacterium]|nr:hypothetical protein [Candidatus Aminicenantes bacterium]
MLVLAIETSCDETSAAVLRSKEPDEGTRTFMPSPGTRTFGTCPPSVLSNIVLSQDEIHAPYGGVVP